MNAISALKLLAEQRSQRAKLEGELAIASELLQQTTAYRHVATLQSSIKAMKQAEAESRYLIVADALLAYKSRDTKQPFPAVSIKVSKLVKYDRLKAHQWCLGNMTLAFKLDEDAFEANMRFIAKSGANPSPLPDFVEVVDDPQVTIATDLSRHLTALDEYDGTTEFPVGEFAPETREV